MSMLVIVISVIVATVYYIYNASRRNFDYWIKKNLPHLKPIPLFGNYGDHILQKRSLGEVVQSICLKFPDEPIIGAFYGNTPAIIVQDPDIIKLITTKDFYYFSGREVSQYDEREPIGRTMFFTHGDNWKIIKQNFAPLLSAAKLKNMFHLVVRNTKILESMIDRELENSENLDTKQIMSRFTMDVIGDCILGIQTNVMADDSESNHFKKIAELVVEVSTLRHIFTTFRSMKPSLFYTLGLKMFPLKIFNFFTKMMTEVMTERKGEPSQRQDLIDLLIEIKKNKYISGERLSSPMETLTEKMQLKIDDELLACQILVFFAGGFETSASTLTFTLYELAKRQDCQELARAEIEAYLKARDGNMSYDCISELPYLLQCIDEAIRMYPVFGVITRDVIHPYDLPNGVHLEPGTCVHIPAYHLHYHPDNFPEPEQYRPERFAQEERHNIKPYTYLPFGAGMRLCVGMRFSRMQTIPALITILSKYHVELAPGTPTKMELEPRTIVIQVKSSVRLKFTKRE